MFELEKMLSQVLWIFPLLLLIIIKKLFSTQTSKTYQNTTIQFPKPYLIIGHLIPYLKLNKDDRFSWATSLVLNSPSSTFIIHRPFGRKSILTGNPTNVKHILKTHFTIYQKGPTQKSILKDLLGDGIFNVDGEVWKFQRQVSSYEFNTKSLKKFVEKVVDSELSVRLIPILSEAAKNRTILDLQDILQRFTFDNICNIAFGYDPKYLSPSLPQAKFAVAFEDAVMISTQRFRNFFPIVWKIKRFLNIGSEKRLKEAVQEIKEFAKSIVIQKKQDILKNSQEDLLSRFLKSGYDQKFVTDIVISFILAGRDTTSSALTWFFWILHKNKRVEDRIIDEIRRNKGKQTEKTDQNSAFEEVKDMGYTHAALCESMRLYPPVPVDTKEACSDDLLPDGTRVKKGMWVTYHTYAMGRMEGIWGVDWAEYRPERWVQMKDMVESGEGKWEFVPKDPYCYPVFQAGPRVCLGKEMAFLQMKRVVAAILERFQVVPVMEEGFEPVYVPNLTAKMCGGLPVRIVERVKELND
ncbi:unnamed protein product [Amaranthus hypochondriacus]